MLNFIANIGKASLNFLASIGRLTLFAAANTLDHLSALLWPAVITANAGYWVFLATGGWADHLVFRHGSSLAELHGIRPFFR